MCTSGQAEAPFPKGAGEDDKAKCWRRKHSSQKNICHPSPSQYWPGTSLYSDHPSTHLLHLEQGMKNGEESVAA